jgi:hypothetical protein
MAIHLQALVNHNEQGSSSNDVNPASQAELKRWKKLGAKQSTIISRLSFFVHQ